MHRRVCGIIVASLLFLLIFSSVGCGEGFDRDFLEEKRPSLKSPEQVRMLETCEEGGDEEPSEPVYSYDYHFKIPILIAVGCQGWISLDVSVDIYDEPQDGNSEGRDSGWYISWDEPLYYKGSTKAVWWTFNGHGFYIRINGPDAFLNTHAYIMIKGRHVSINIEFHFTTGVLPTG